MKHSFIILLTLLKISSLIAMSVRTLEETQITDEQQNAIGTIKITHCKCFCVEYINADKKIVGTCTYQYDSNKKKARIILLDVEKTERKKGYGKVLLAYVYNHVQNQGCTYISGEIPKNREDLSKYFSKLGATISTSKDAKEDLVSFTMPPNNTIAPKSKL